MSSSRRWGSNTIPPAQGIGAAPDPLTVAAGTGGPGRTV
jgi:hypothetical protein